MVNVMLAKRYNITKSYLFMKYDLSYKQWAV